MAKQQAEWSNNFSIFWLKKNGYLPAGGIWRSGGIKWTYGISGNESSISFVVTTDGSEEDNIRLQYTHTSRETGEKEDMDYQMGLTTTPCNYGGKRYWFICLLTKNGKYCGRRVGVLYNLGRYFGCRYCGNIAYAAQMEGGRYRWNGVSIKDIEKAEQEVKRYYYRGEPTRKYRRLLKLNVKFKMSYMMMAARVDKRFDRFTNLKK